MWAGELSIEKVFYKPFMLWVTFPISFFFPEDNPDRINIISCEWVMKNSWKRERTHPITVKKKKGREVREELGVIYPNQPLICGPKRGWGGMPGGPDLVPKPPHIHFVYFYKGIAKLYSKTTSMTKPKASDKFAHLIVEVS